jgi:hypothetical protein
LGAQLQRIVAIRALSLRLGTKYLHSDLSEITAHPLDEISGKEEISKFLTRVNNTFFLESEIDASWPELEVTIDSISLRKLILVLSGAFLRRRNVLIRIVEPYSLMELIPSDYQNVRKLFINFPKFSDSGTELVMHYRYGVGRSVIQPGEKIPRQLDLEYFKGIAQEIQRMTNFNIHSLTILTDAPATNITFEPTKDQIHLWDGTPGFKNGMVVIESFDFMDVLGNLGLDIEVISGGDALESLLKMSSADYLILSRSSLSYVGALFNQRYKAVYSAPGFWHPRMQDWI